MNDLEFEREVSSLLRREAAVQLARWHPLRASGQALVAQFGQRRRRVRYAMTALFVVAIASASVAAVAVGRKAPPSTPRPRPAPTTTVAKPKVPVVNADGCPPPWTGRAADMVDTTTGQRIARLELLCLGYVTAKGVIATGANGDPALFVPVATEAGDGNQPARVVEVDLRDYSVTKSAVFGDIQQPLAGIGEIWTSFDGPGPNDATLIGLDTRDLAVEHRLVIDDLPDFFGFDFVTFDGYVWIADGASGLLRYDPADGKLADVSLKLAPSNSVASVTASSRLLYLGVSGDTGADNAIDSYSPATGALTRYPQGALMGYLPAPGGFAWISPIGGNHGSVAAGAVLPGTQSPANGASCGGFNGTWSAYFTTDAEMFCEPSGMPLTCASGETGRVLASLTVPGATASAPGTPGTSPVVIAVGDGFLVLAATQESEDGVSNGLAFYDLDPRCGSG